MGILWFSGGARLLLGAPFLNRASTSFSCSMPSASTPRLNGPETFDDEAPGEVWGDVVGCDLLLDGEPLNVPHALDPVGSDMPE